MWKTIEKDGLPDYDRPVYLLEKGNNNIFIAFYKKEKGKFDVSGYSHDVYYEMEPGNVLKYHEIIYPTYIN